MRAYDCSDQRASFLPAFLHNDNYHLPPASRRLKTADNVLTYNNQVTSRRG